MATTTTPTAPGRTQDGPRTADRLCHATGALLILSGLFHLGVLAVDGGPWDGPVSWRKPVTFGLSFGLTLLAVVWVTSYLDVGARPRTVLLAVFAADCVVEVGGITVQAWRHVPSHLDMESGFDTAVSMTLAAGGAVLVAVLSAFAVASFRHRPTGPAGMPLALRSGFAILLVALLSGAAMIGRGVYLTRTGHQSAAYASTAPSSPCTASASTPSSSSPPSPGCCPAPGWPPRRRRASSAPPSPSTPSRSPRPAYGRCSRTADAAHGALPRSGAMTPAPRRAGVRGGVSTR